MNIKSGYSLYEIWCTLNIKCHNCLVSLFNGISTDMGYLMPYYWTHNLGGVRWFISSPTVNRIMRLEFQIVYFEAAVQHFNHYAMRILIYIYIYIYIYIL